jgi:anti-anti-sigma regulatory factor
LGQTPEPSAIVLAIGSTIDRREILALCDRLRDLLATNPGKVVTCDLTELDQADVAVVDAIIRLTLTARRHGRQLQIRQASPELQDLLALMGLSEVVTLEPSLALPPEWQAEEREQPRGVKEEADPGDPIF